MKTFWKIAALVVLLLPATASAVTVTNRYVNTDCANNGNGTASTCAGSPGGAGAYTTLDNALLDIASDFPNFVSADVQLVVHCKGAAADTSEPDVAGFTTDATRNIIIQTDSGDRHDGAWNSSKYRIVNGAYHGTIWIHAPFTKIVGMQLENNRTGSGGGTYCSGILITLAGATTAGRIEITDSIIRSTGDQVNCSAKGIEDEWLETSGVTKVFKNNIIYDWIQGGYFRSTDSGAVYLYNNTIYSNVSGSYCYIIRNYGTGATYVYKNNIANGSCTGWSVEDAGSATHSNNLAEDTTSPDDTYDSKAVAFVNEGSRNLHLDTSDTNAKNAGADLSGATEGMTTDIDQQTRTGTWDIGADEFISSGSAVPALINLGY